MQRHTSSRGGERYLHHYTEGWHVIIAPNRLRPKAGGFVGYLTHHRGDSQFRAYGDTIDEVVHQLEASYEEWRRQHTRGGPSHDRPRLSQ
jgi:hypothetical protein